MKALPAALLLAASGWLVVPLEWRHNPRERTTAGLEAWQRGDHAAAAAALTEALELAPDEPLARYNAGTGRLGTGDLDPALELLASAAAAGDAALVPDAFYNLGNALLERDDVEAAVDAYKRALRSDPGHAAAKHNLELALRQQEQQGGSEERQGAEGEGDDSRGGGGGSADGEPTSDDSGADEHPAGGGEPAPGDPGNAPQEEDSPLPQFQDQEDMTAAQAASLLEAVEGLEREQRRAHAEEQRRQRAARLGWERDW